MGSGGLPFLRAMYYFDIDKDVTNIITTVDARYRNGAYTSFNPLSSELWLALLMTRMPKKGVCYGLI